MVKNLIKSFAEKPILLIIKYLIYEELIKFFKNLLKTSHKMMKKNKQNWKKDVKI